ncbi:MAG: GyrI-like domain-containing protein [Burkholderiaceae bacterium]
MNEPGETIRRGGTSNFRMRMTTAFGTVTARPDEARLAEISRAAACSPYYFHRRFTQLFGLPVGRYAQLLRLERASYQLAFRWSVSVTEVAMDAGYSAPDAFAKAFSKRFGQSPSGFRRQPEWQRWQVALAPLDAVRSKHMPQRFSIDEVSVVTREPVAVAVLSHVGDPARLGDSIRRFIAWRRAAGLSPQVSDTYNVFHCDPRSTPPERYRLDLCAATTNRIDDDPQGVTAGLIPGGRCARLRVVGGGHDLEAPADFLLRTWLPHRDEVAAGPLFCQRVRFFPDVAEHEAITDLYLPLAER